MYISSMVIKSKAMVPIKLLHYVALKIEYPIEGDHGFCHDPQLFNFGQIKLAHKDVLKLYGPILTRSHITF